MCVRCTQRGIGGRWRESHEIDQVDGGTATVEEAHQVDERVAAVVAARCGQCPTPLVKLRVERG